ncbi:MAG: HNH endonuclease [bacterium]
MDFKFEKFNKNITNEELIEDLKKIAGILNKNTLSINEYNEIGKGKYDSKTLTRRFGSWNKALNAANLDLTLEMNIKEEELFLNMYNLWIKIGRQPRRREMRKPLSKYSESAYIRSFGSWNLALEKFIEYISAGININYIESQDLNENKLISINNEIIHQHKTKRDPNWRLRFLVMRRDDFKCLMCGKAPANYSGVELHIDHIIPWSRGGETVIENLQTLCSVCNIGKSNLT